jgi:hypothetical protein
MAKAARAKSNNGESLTGYFRRVFKENPKLLRGRKNAQVLQIWLRDNPGHTDIPKNVKIAMANAKSAIRGKKRRRTSAAREAGDATAVAVRTRRPAGMVSKLEALEVQIDDCLIAARALESDGLDEVLKLLRRARNEVVLLIGE